MGCLSASRPEGNTIPLVEYPPRGPDMRTAMRSWGAGGPRPLPAAPGDAAAAAAMEARAAALRTAFRAAFLRNGTWDSGAMTAHVLPVALGLAEAGVRGLVAELRAHRDHFTTGILGFRHLFAVLDAHGEAERALAVLLRTDYPSIAYNFANGKEAATTNLWEVWGRAPPPLSALGVGGGVRGPDE